MSKVKIVTHNSSFHSDDVFAVATLSLVLEKDPPATPCEAWRAGGKEIEIIRTRDPEIINGADFVVDVGGKYDSDKNRFDHHQVGGGGKRENGIPYASFGLVWKKFGEGLCGDKKIAEMVDKKIVQPIDAHDTGVDYLESNKFNLYPYAMDDVVEAFRPTWQEVGDFDSSFIKVVDFAKYLISREIIVQKSIFDSGMVLAKSYNERTNEKILVLDYKCDWEEHIADYPDILFVVYPKDNGTWAIENVRDNPKSYLARKNLPLSWSGKRDKELEEVTGVEGAMFCHTDCFIAVAKTKEAIMKLAELALKV